MNEWYKSLLCGLLVLLSSDAMAAGLLETVGGASGPSALSARAVAGGPQAAYFNPSLMLYQPAQTSVGFFVLAQRLDIGLGERPASADIDASIYNARQRNPDGTTGQLERRPLPTDALPGARGSATRGDVEHSYATIGVVSHLIENRLALGVNALVPLGDFQAQRPFYVDEREQYFSNSLHFERFSDRADANVFSFALAGRPLNWLSLGVGVTMANDASANNQVFVPDAIDQTNTDMNSAIRVKTRFVPHASVVVEPLEGVRLGATVHGAHAATTRGENKLRIWNYPYPEGQDSEMQTFEYLHGFQPLRIGASAAYEHHFDEDNRLEVALCGLWSEWSDYRDRHAERPQSAWSDTITAALGLAFYGASQRVSLDVTYEPSPVPDQLGRSNYVDNARLGSALAWSMPFTLGGLGFEGGVHVQGHRLLYREVTKSADAEDPVIDEYPESVDIRTDAEIESSRGLQTNNPGYPGFSSEGWLAGGGLFLKMFF